ncbi:hypothetical protein EBZ70_06510 [bacterium]|nr:hypothetical protein [bacterium]
MKTTARILACLLFSGASLIAAVPATINYQGVVADSSGTLLGASGAINRKVIFRIFDASTGGTRLWTEEQTVTIYKGEFSVLLGAGTTATGTASSETRPALDTVFTGSATNRFIEIMVDNGDSSITASDSPISPRQSITSAAFAFRSQVAESILSGSDLTITPTSGTASNYGLGWYGSGRQWNGFSVDGPVLYGNSGGVLGSKASGTQATALLWDASGRVGIGAIGDFRDTNKLVLQGNDANTPAQQLMIRGNTDASKRLLIGFDTTNNRATLQSYTATSTTGPLLLNPSGGLVGIGTSAPAARLSVEGSISATGAGGYIFGTGGDVDGGLFSPSDGVVTLNTNGTERLRADASGRVSVVSKLGIGTTTPTAKLTISDDSVSESGTFGSVQINRAATGHVGAHVSFCRVGSNDCGLGYGQSSSVFGFGPGGGGAFTPSWLGINPSGNVGIGTAPSSTYKLDVTGRVHITEQVDLDNSIVMGNDDLIYGKNLSGVDEGCFWPRGGNNGTYLNFGSGGFYIRDNANNSKMQITNDGTVQIGTTGVSARLNIGTKYNSLIYTVGYLDTNGGQSGDYNGPRDMSITAEGMVGANQIAVFSDVRIKTDLHVSDTVKDLETLKGIEVTDYYYKDKFASGKGPQKKVIAQQVEMVYPQAVVQTTGVVPDLFKKAPVKDGWVELATDLKKGDRVKLIGKKAEAIHEVLEIRDGAFRPDGQVVDEQVFVYGREVKDFRTVDYDAISMLNVSATQELARKLETVQAENAALRRELVEQAKRAAAQADVDTAQNARLVALEKLLLEKAGGLQTATLKSGK